MVETGGSIAVVAKHTPLAFLLYMTKFVIEVDGTEHSGSWGARSVPVAPGQHTVRMWFGYLGKPCGKAEVSVNTTAGGTTSISYHAPIFVFSPGKANVQ